MLKIDFSHIPSSLWIEIPNVNKTSWGILKKIIGMLKIWLLAIYRIEIPNINNAKRSWNRAHECATRERGVRTNIARGPARSGCCTCPPLQNLSQKLRRRHMAREDKTPHACLVKRTPPSANRQKREWDMIFALSVGRSILRGRLEMTKTRIIERGYSDKYALMVQLRLNISFPKTC